MFQIDKQTLTDINALDWNSASLLRFFDNTRTIGGRDMLYAWFLRPLQHKMEILERQQAIAYLANEQNDKLFDKYMMTDLERYLSMPRKLDGATLVQESLHRFSSFFSGLSYRRHQLFIRQSVCEIASIFLTIYAIVERSKTSNQNRGLLRHFESSMTRFLNGLEMAALRKLASGKVRGSLIRKYDKRFRSSKRSDVAELFQMLYMLDALSGIAKALDQKPLSFPVIHEGRDKSNPLEIRELYHLALTEPVKNDVIISRDKNVWFLTGANMTGKSTLLKAIGSCVYLAHLGLPVPAAHMETSLFSGMLTSINLADQIDSGFSHFFAEVNRLKLMGQHIDKHGPMLIMLDELFKGTNYEDAYEATLSFLDSIDGIGDSLFFVSTHIAELGLLLEKRDHIALKRIDTEADDHNGITFTYKLADGVATAKLGMWFLKREQVFETFQSIRTRNR